MNKATENKIVYTRVMTPEGHAYDPVNLNDLITESNKAYGLELLEKFVRMSLDEAIWRDMDRIARKYGLGVDAGDDVLGQGDLWIGIVFYPNSDINNSDDVVSSTSITQLEALLFYKNGGWEDICRHEADKFKASLEKES